MTKESAFDRKHLEGTAPRHDIWDELNLPPGVVHFLQRHGKYIAAALACLVLIYLGWSFYGQYQEKRQENAAALFSEALRQGSGPQRHELLLRVSSEYPGTAAATWSQIQLAHDAHAAGEFQEAVTSYESALQHLSERNPLTPLVHYSLAQSHEAGGNPEQALRHYQRLATSPGFAGRGLAAEARIQELQNRPAEAIKAYERLAALEGQSELVSGLLEEKLAVLRSKAKAVDLQ